MNEIHATLHYTQTFRLVIRSSTGWSRRDRTRVLVRAGALRRPAAEVTERGLELSVRAQTPEEAREKVEAAVQGIHSHTGVYLVTELSLLSPFRRGQLPTVPNESGHDWKNRGRPGEASFFSAGTPSVPAETGPKIEALSSKRRATA